MLQFIAGNRSSAIEINLPASGCGVRSEPKSDGSLELSVRLIVQMDEKLRQQTDIERTIRCELPDQMMEMAIGERNNKQMFRYSIAGVGIVQKSIETRKLS